MSKKQGKTKKATRARSKPAPPPVTPPVPPPAAKSLTAKQQGFVEEYLIDRNATQAAIRAGYSRKTAQEQSSRLLSNVMVRAALDAALAQRSERTEVTADRVVLELARIGFSDLKGAMQDGRLLLIEDMGDEVRPAISSIKVVTKNKGEGEIEYVAEIRAWDKVSALRALMPHVGLSTDKTESKVTADLSPKTLEAINEKARHMEYEELVAFELAAIAKERAALAERELVLRAKAESA